MANLYATLDDVKRVLVVPVTGHDVALMSYLESASRVADDFTGRQFFVDNETRYYGTHSTAGGGLVFEDDVLAITTVTADSEGDYTYDGETWVEGTDFVVQPDNSWPKGSIILHPSGSYSAPRNRVRYFKLIGQFGYGDGESATPFARIAPTMSEIADAITTTATISAADVVEAGQTLLLGSEQVYVSGVSSTTLTIERGVNGTTAASHAAALVIDVYLYPKPITMGCANIAAAAFKRGKNAGLKSELIGAYQYVVETAKEDGDKLLRMLGPYRAPWAVV